MFWGSGGTNVKLGLLSSDILSFVKRKSLIKFVKKLKKKKVK